jgi:hypothetical protein
MVIQTRRARKPRAPRPKTYSAYLDQELDEKFHFLIAVDEEKERRLLNGQDPEQITYTEAFRILIEEKYERYLAEGWSPEQFKEPQQPKLPLE